MLCSLDPNVSCCAPQTSNNLQQYQWEKKILHRNERHLAPNGQELLEVRMKETRRFPQCVEGIMGILIM